MVNILCFSFPCHFWKAVLVSRFKYFRCRYSLIEVYISANGHIKGGLIFPSFFFNLVQFLKNNILLPKLFWPTVRKKCFSDWEKILKFEAESREIANFLRLLEQFIQTVKEWFPSSHTCLKMGPFWDWATFNKVWKSNYCWLEPMSKIRITNWIPAKFRMQIVLFQSAQST